MRLPLANRSRNEQLWNGPTVLERLCELVRTQPNKPMLTLVDCANAPVSLSASELYRAACNAAGGLRRLGVGPGDRVLIALPTGLAAVATYLGSLLAKVIPVIVPPSPASGAPSERTVSAERAGILRTQCDAALVVQPTRDGAAAALHPSTTPMELFGNGDDAGYELQAGLGMAGPEDVAHLQLTSGTTGNSKLAVIRHRHLASNVEGIRRAIAWVEEDRIVSWLPLYHDMGLVCVACALCWHTPLYLTDPSNFVRHPVNNWLGLISQFNGTLSPAPASAYRLCTRLGRARGVGGLELSRWRVAFCGAEPVSAEVLEEFQRTFEPCGLRRGVLRPVYGLAEATLAVTIPPSQWPLDVDKLDGPALAAERQALPVHFGTGGHRSVVSVGLAIEGHEVRIVDPAGVTLVDRHVGEVEVRGPSVIDSYWHEGNGVENPAQPRPYVTRPDGYLRTGDLGYTSDGRLFITGRAKDVIILNGRNVHPDDVEATVRNVLADLADDSRAGSKDGVVGVAAFGCWNDAAGSEELNIVIETRAGAPPPHVEEITQRIRARLLQFLGAGGAHIRWVKKGFIPRTSSGKIQRFRCRELFGPIPERPAQT